MCFLYLAELIQPLIHSNCFLLLLQFSQPVIFCRYVSSSFCSFLAVLFFKSHSFWNLLLFSLLRLRLINCRTSFGPFLVPCLSQCLLLDLVVHGLLSSSKRLMYPALSVLLLHSFEQTFVFFGSQAHQRVWDLLFQFFRCDWFVPMLSLDCIDITLWIAPIFFNSVYLKFYSLCAEQTQLIYFSFQKVHLL